MSDCSGQGDCIAGNYANVDNDIDLDDDDIDDDDDENDDNDIIFRGVFV